MYFIESIIYFLIDHTSSTDEGTPKFMEISFNPGDDEPNAYKPNSQTTPSSSSFDDVTRPRRQIMKPKRFEDMFLYNIFE